MKAIVRALLILTVVGFIAYVLTEKHVEARKLWQDVLDNIPTPK